MKNLDYGKLLSDYGNVLVLHIDDTNRIRQSAHLLDAAKTALQLVHHTGT